MKHPHSPFPHALKDTTKKPGLLKRVVGWVCDSVQDWLESTPFIECHPHLEPDDTTVAEVLLAIAVFIGLPTLAIWVMNLANTAS